MISVKNLTKNFVDEAGELPVIRDSSFSITRGEMVALVGVSGSGKTTLLQILGGLDRATSGTIEIEGKVLQKMTPPELAAFRNKFLGFVFQFHHLMPDFTALENVIIPGLIGGEKQKQCEGRARDLLELFGLTSRLSHYPSELSGGERQRVALARALFNKPALVLADEPTGSLDREHSKLLLEMLIRANRELGQTFLVATHNERLAEGMHRTMYIEDGNVISSSNRVPA
jgi:lipoprotein-releasing system ATP-binding protein